MLFYSHCNLLADCFLRSEQSKNKQIRGSVTEPNRKIFQGLCPLTSTRALPWTCWRAHSNPQTSNCIEHAFGVLQRPSVLALKTSRNFSVFLIKIEWHVWVYNVWLKKVQESYLSWHWRVMQNLKKNWLVVGKWHEEFGKFSSKHLKVSKLVLSWDPFVQSRKWMS